MAPEKKVSEIWSVSEISRKTALPQTEAELSQLLLGVSTGSCSYQRC